jgi:hypothetical protein
MKSVYRGKKQRRVLMEERVVFFRLFFAVLANLHLYIILL